MDVFKNTIPENLKCDMCNEIISCSPVYVKKSGKSACGRCYSSKIGDQFVAQNIAYEALAQYLLFPCKYNEKGCKVRETLEEMQLHEEQCEFLEIICPLKPIGKCDWRGKCTEVRQHCEDKHPESVVEHPFNIKPDISKNFEDNLLMTAFGYHFLIQTKCYMLKHKIWHCVKLLASPVLVPLFMFKVEFSTEKDILIRKEHVQVNDRNPINQHTSIERDISSLFKLLDGGYRNADFTISVVMNEEKCVECKQNLKRGPVYKNTKGYLCRTCLFRKNKTKSREQRVSNEMVSVSTQTDTTRTAEEEQTHNNSNQTKSRSEDDPVVSCNYKLLGCPFTNISNPEIFGKHYTWLCKYSKQYCNLCQSDILGTSKLQHTIDTHLTLQEDTLSFPDLKEKIYYRAAFKYDGVMFYCAWNVRKYVLNLNVISDLAKEEMGKYKFELELANPVSRYSVKKEVCLKPTADSDWRLMDLDKLGDVFEDGVYEMKLIVSKVDEEI